MLYVAGEILLWMLLAFALGIGAGWAIWGLRSRQEEERAAVEQQSQINQIRDEAARLHAQNQDLLAVRARDAATIAQLQQSASGDTAPLVARVRELEAELQGKVREADLLRQRLFELEQVQAQALAAAERAAGEGGAPEGEAAGDGGAPTAPVPAAAGPVAAEQEQRLQAVQADLDEMRTRFAELGKAFGGQLDLGDPAAVRVRWSAMQARAAESEHLARQLDGLRAVLGGQLDPGELQERFTELETRAGEADALRARLAELGAEDGPEAR
ncbi:MAG TPA: hypothetical protein VG478_07690 [Acidimicrobiales bacterium]|nr:hypothetical protein [Acidimicrobiales bacterium]